jgi:ribosomal protein S18 acetylase RimI-like enzyme
MKASRSLKADSMLIRRVVPGDMHEFIELCTAHAEFERSRSPPPRADRLTTALFVGPVRLHAWVAVDDNAKLCGYASATLDYSTWSASDFLHLDCLYVSPHYRGRNIGRELFDHARGYARSLGLAEMQWQTPEWNTDAQRFYERLNPQSSEKLRYVLAI